MAILYGFPVTEARRRVPRFYKLQEMQEPPSEVIRRRRVQSQRQLAEATAGNGLRRARRMQGEMHRGRARVYPRLADLGL